MIPIYRLVFVILILLVKIVRNQELTAEVLSVKLPFRLAYVSSVYDGQDAIYIIGGFLTGGSIRGDIYKYSLTEQTLTKEGLLPSPRAWGDALMDDKRENIYYFGGYNGGSKWEIYKFNFATNSTIIVSNLTTSSYWHAAVKYKDVTSKVFLIGGYPSTDKSIQCWDIDLQSNCPTQTMDTSFGAAAAVSFKNEAFVFGNANNTSERDLVYKINLNTFETSFGERTLPHFRGSHAAVIVGPNAYIIGGWDNQTNFPTNSIIQINLDSLEQTVLTVKNFIPNKTYLYATSAVYVEKLNRIYVIGGASSPQEYYDEIWSIDLSPIYVPPTTESTSTAPTTGPTSPSPSTS